MEAFFCFLLLGSGLGWCVNGVSFSSVYALDKVRLLYNLTQPTARLVVRDRNDLETPLVSLRSSRNFEHLTDGFFLFVVGHDTVVFACYEPHSSEMYVDPFHFVWTLDLC